MSDQRLGVDSNVTAGVPVLKVEGLRAGYGHRPVIFDAHFEIRTGEVVGLIGHNGAGKSTTLSAVYGSLKPGGGRVTLYDRDITGRSPRRNMRAGVSLVRSERFTFGELTVEENLLLGGLHVKGEELQKRLAKMYELFPVLKDSLGLRASELSGGQQRQLSIGMALVAQPKVMLLDEPSLGIAPSIVARIFDTVRGLALEEGLSVLIVEQNVKQLLRVADRVYVMRSGRVILEESAAQMQKRPSLWDLF